MDFAKLRNSIYLWRAKNIQQKHFVLFLSLIVGLLSGMAAVLLKNTVHYIQELLSSDISLNVRVYFYFGFPLIGLILTVLLVKYVFKGKLNVGIPGVLQAISKNNSVIRTLNTFSSIASSALTVGFGGSVGLEGPAVSSSGAIGSSLGRFLKLDYKTVTLLIGCGTVGAMSGIFNAPIAALVFALEVFMFDLSLTSMIPFLMASVSATITSRLMLGDNVLFNIQIQDGFYASDVPFYVLLGVFTGLFSVYFNKVYWFIEEAFGKLQKPLIRLFVGGSLLGVLIFLMPPLYGEGFVTIKQLLSGNYGSLVNDTIFYDLKDNVLVMLGLILGLALFKVIATALTLGAGGIGGVFAPSLFVGATSGFLFTKAMNHFGLAKLSESNFTLVGMAGLIAGVLHAPLTALFLIAEITSGYELIIPLMITVAISYLTSKYFVPHSLYNMQLAKRGELIARSKDKQVLTLMNLKSQVETDFGLVKPGAKLGELVTIISTSKRNLFPVVDSNDVLIGIIRLDDIRDIIFNPELYDEVEIESIMIRPEVWVDINDSMDQVMDKFTKANVWNLPVLDDGKYLGFVSRSKLFSAYRKKLIDYTEN